MPFITEEIWHVLRAKVKAEAWPDSIYAASYPRPGPVDEAAERGFGPVIGIVDAIRNVRGEMNIPFKVVLEDVEIGSLGREAEATVREELGRIHRLANVREAVVHRDGSSPAPPAGERGGGRRRASRSAWGSPARSTSRRSPPESPRKSPRWSRTSHRIERKLANPSFVEKAPPEVVEKDRARAEELREKRGKLEAHRAMLSDTLDSPAANPGRREPMENENQNPGTNPSQPTSQPAEPSSGAMDTMEKVVSTVSEVGKAIGSAVASGVETAVERVRKATGQGAKRKAPKRKAAARKAAPRKAAKKTAKKKVAKKVARKPAKKAAKRGGKKKASKKR